MSKQHSHGTMARYQGGCRCDACRAGWATYIRERRYRLGLQRPRAEQRFYESATESTGDLKVSTLAKRRFEAMQERSGLKKGDVFERMARHVPLELFDTLA